MKKYVKADREIERSSEAENYISSLCYQMDSISTVVKNLCDAGYADEELLDSAFDFYTDLINLRDYHAGRI